MLLRNIAPRCEGIAFYPAKRALGITDWPQGGKPVLPPLAFGRVPPEVLSSASKVSRDRVNHEGRTADKIVVDSESHEITYYVDSELKRYRTAELRQSDGTLMRRERLSDFRQVGQMIYPFVCIEQTFASDGFLSRERIYTVENVTVDAELPESEFRLTLPAYTNISLFAGDDKKVFGINREVSICLDSARGIWDAYSRGSE